MRKIPALLLCLTLQSVLSAHSQEVDSLSLLSQPHTELQSTIEPILSPATAEPMTSAATPSLEEPLSEETTLHLPPLNMRGQFHPLGAYRYYWNGAYPWTLHPGLNVNLTASVFTQLGKHAYHGAGFAQSASAMYAMPLSQKLSLAVGGYVNHLSWAHDSYYDGGLSGVLSYQFNEHLEGFVYGQKSLVNKRMPLPLYDVSNIGDRIGVGAAYHFSPAFSIAVSVEHVNYPQMPLLRHQPPTDNQR